MNQGMIGWSSPQSVLSVPYVNVQDQKTSGTAGGTFTQGAWQTRTLNTIVADSAGVASLASNQITLQPGTYRARAVAPAYNAVGRHAVRIQNITLGTTLALGAVTYLSGSESCLSEASGRFTLSASAAIEVQHRCEITRATDGFGLAGSWGTEVFATIELWKDI